MIKLTLEVFKMVFKKEKEKLLMLQEKNILEVI